MAAEAQDRSSGEAPLTPQEMLQLMIERGAPALAIENQRRLCGLPATERPEPKITLRPVTVAAPKRRPSTRKTRKKITTASAATSKSRVATRFDLDF